MRSAPLISIIMPFLNTENFIGEAIESVISQTESDWELLLIDDGSIDGSTEIAQEYGDRYPDRIRYLEHEHHRNLGASASRNLGGAHARGTYIAYLDSDDLWFSHKLEEQRNILETISGADMVIGATKYWWSWRDKTKEDCVIEVGAAQNTLYSPGELLPIIYPLGIGAAPSVNTIIIRSDMVRKVGGWVDKFRVSFTDQAFLVKCYLFASTYVTSSCWDMYRQRHDSSSHMDLAGSRYQEVKFEFFCWFNQYLNQLGMERSEAARLVRRAIWMHRHPRLGKVFRRIRS
jgi:glycosyltransferase involved in cell wall biosynthesis